MKRLFLTVLMVLASMSTITAKSYGEDERVVIWDNASAPHSNNITKEESEIRPDRLIDVTRAELLIYGAPLDMSNGQAVLLCPGGGYGLLSMDQEGYIMAKWFAEQGITAAVLKYRMPNGVKEVPYEDGVEALRLLRERSMKYRFMKDQVGIAGFSAGGHLAAYISTMAPEEAKPNFTLLFYPVITGEEGKTHKGTFNKLLGEGRNADLTEYYSLENRVTKTTPPAFILACDDDMVVPTISSSRYYTALKENGVRASMHIYPVGGHGWGGYFDQMKYSEEWRAALLDWMEYIKLPVEKPKAKPTAEKYVADEVITFKHTPTSDLKLHIYYPNDQKAGSNRPAVVSFFGGGWNTGTPEQFFAQSEYYASLGVVAISAEYRVRNRDKTTPFECVADGKSAIRWVRANAEALGIDPDRIVASGGSAGGHVAACTALIEDFDDKSDANPEVSSVPNAMILFNPVVNTTAEGYGYYRFNGEELTLSPTHHVREGMPPTLMFHGSQDTVVPFKNATEFAKLMKLYGNDIRLEVGFGETHSYFNSKFVRSDGSPQQYAKSMYEATKFLMELNYIPKREVAKPEAIRVACVGDVTSVHSELQKILGDEYVVRNFDFEGATVLSEGGKPFAESAEYKALYGYEADVVIFMLGANDSRVANREHFVKQYKALAKGVWVNPNNRAEIFFCRTAGGVSEVMEREIGPSIEQVRKGLKRMLPAIDIRSLGDDKSAARRIYNLIANTKAQNAKVEKLSKANGVTYDGVIASDDFHAMRGGLKNSYKKFKDTKEGTVAFVGGSITYNAGWRDRLCEYLEAKFPETKFTFINAGISSEGTTSAAFRLERDVISKGGIDLLFEEAAVNDSALGELRTTEATRIKGMEGIVRHIREANPMVDIVMMHFVDTNKVADYTKGVTPLEIRDFEIVAEHYKIPSINLAKEVTERINAGEFSWRGDFKNIHPSPFGQSVYLRSMTNFLDKAFAEGAKSKRMVRYKMAKPIDKLCYDKGRFITVDRASLGEGWSIDPAWRPSNGQSMRDINSLHLVKPCIVANGHTAGEMTLEFKGSTIGIVAISGADAGRIDYTIDGVKYDTYELATRNSLVQYLPRYYTLATDLDPNESHILKISVAAEGNPKMKGNACYIARFFVNE